MALVRRKRGEAALLPDGVVARMQLSPYRIQLAGIQTARRISAARAGGGIVGARGAPARRRPCAVEIPARQAPWIAEGQAAEVVCADLPGRTDGGPGRRSMRSSADGWECAATVAIDRSAGELRAGMIASVRITMPMAALEPFRSLPADPPAFEPGEPRRAVCLADHPDRPAIAPGRCPIDRKPRERDGSPSSSASRWWCPMHPDVTADRPGSACQACGGMVLGPRVISYRPAGQVLAVPQSAVVDAGARKVVFVESMPGMFDGVEVVLGPRCGDFYPVVRGLEPGQRVAIAGAFLLDAETRLNPSLAAGYFGAGAANGRRGAARRARHRGEIRRRDGASRARSRRSRAGRAQKICPVTGKPLGSMGTPARVVVSGRVVFLCCDGCEERSSESSPSSNLAKLPASQAHDRRDHHLLDPPPRPGHRREPGPGRARRLGRLGDAGRRDPRPLRKPGHRLHRVEGARPARDRGPGDLSAHAGPARAARACGSCGRRATSASR